MELFQVAFRECAPQSVESGSVQFLLTCPCRGMPRTAAPMVPNRNMVRTQEPHQAAAEHPAIVSQLVAAVVGRLLPPGSRYRLSRRRNAVKGNIITAVSSLSPSKRGMQASKRSAAWQLCCMCLLGLALQLTAAQDTNNAQGALLFSMGKYLANNDLDKLAALGWVNGGNPCSGTWTGVTCNPEGQTVTSV